jgi:hypothetical protein
VTSSSAESLIAGPGALIAAMSSEPRPRPMLRPWQSPSGQTLVTVYDNAHVRDGKEERQRGDCGLIPQERWIYFDVVCHDLRGAGACGERWRYTYKIRPAGFPHRMGPATAKGSPMLSRHQHRSYRRHAPITTRGKRVLRSARAVAGASALVIAALGAAVPAGAARASGPHTWARTGFVVQLNHPAPAGMTPRAAVTMPLRVPDPAAYAAEKAAADAGAARLAGRAPSLTAARLGPSLLRNWAGQRDRTAAPSDSTGAIGITRYIELVNARAAIYSRTSNTPLASGSLFQLTGCVTSGCTETAFDVQVIWDPGTNRFYYVADDIVSSSENLIDIGFSTSASPTLSAGSWCRYNLNFGASFPDYPKLGDTRNFMLTGFNLFSGTSFAGSGIAWLTKPPSGPRCPAASTFKAGTAGPLRNANGSPAFTPVPGNQADPGPTGWAVARPATIPARGATFLTLFKVTRSASGTATIPATGTAVPVGAYRIPASAPQPGTAFKLDTLDARNTQAVLAADPAHRGALALWTQHAVFGGAGSEVRWYEINPATHSLIQHGTVTSRTRFTFDGAVSSDRRANGASRKFGGSMVIDVVQSSRTVRPVIEVASKIGAAAISGLTVIATSAASDTGFDCIQSGVRLCRWGDYAGASPDPASPVAGTRGLVWGSSMLAAAGGSASSSGWTTRNFAVKP